jgi:ribosomal protein S2
MPGNDDAGRAITLYCDLIARAAIDGIGRAQGDVGRRSRRLGEAGRGRPAGGELPTGVRALPARAALPTTQEAHRRFGRDREEAQRSRHLPLLADR